MIHCRQTICFPIILLLIIAISSLVACTSDFGEAQTNEGSITEAYTDSSDSFDSDLVKQILSEMTLREKIGQLFFVSARGNFINKNSESYQELTSRISRHHAGGVMFFGGNIYNQAHLTNRLQTKSNIPLMISQDMEFGAAMRIRDATYFTPAMGIAATGNPEFAYKKGKITAREARALGVHQIYAPVADVNNNPGNPIINVRSFSEDPEMVAEYAGAFFRGVKSEGLLATAKHFPGHGDTDIDSHLSLPTIPHDYARLDSLELIPFRSLIDQGIPSIMTAHISFPAVSSQPGLPGTLDGEVVNTILRDSLNFNGLVVSDALEMEGLAANYSPGRAAVGAIKAGVDVLLVPPDLLTAIDEIERSVHRGELDEENINKSVRRILTWKERLGLFDEDQIDIDALADEIRKPEYEQLSGRIARESLTLLRNKGDILPIRPYQHPRVQVIALADDRSGVTGSSFARAVRAHHPDVGFRIFDRRTHAGDVEQMIRDANRADLVILASYIRVRTSQSIQLSRSQQNFLNRLQNLNPPSALVSFGNPYVFEDYPEADVHLAAWSTASSQIRAAADALFGGSRIAGTLPISIPDLYEIGDGIKLEKSTLREDEPKAAGFDSEKLRTIEDTVRAAIQDSVFPGATVAVSRNGITAYHESFGYHDYEKMQPVRSTDMYDLASVTKVAATTLATMKLVDEGELSVDDKVAEYLSAFRKAGKEDITIRQLLTHTSGLPAFRTYVDEITQPDELLEAILNQELETTPGEEYIYSDLGFIILANIIEKITGTTLNSYLTSNFYYPLGMQWTMFNPLQRSQSYRNRIPPTEVDTTYRNKTVRGQVHDERAYYLGGVAGHAGLFSTAHNLSIFSQMLLNEGRYGGREFISPETIQKFTELQDTPGHRALGFDLRSPEGFTTTGKFTSDRTFGHLGFTGTSLWIDPENNLSVILLTNRTYPDRSFGSEISRIRADIADIVMNSLELYNEMEIADR